MNGGRAMGNMMLRAVRAAGLVACFAAVGSAVLASEIETAQAAWEAAFASGSGTEAAEAVFTEDARLLPPDGPIVEGRAAIAEFWQSAFDAGVHSLELGLTDVEILGDTMIETGTWSVMVPDGEGGEVQASGKALVIWKKGADGAWRMSQDMWNSNE